MRAIVGIPGKLWDTFEARSRLRDNSSSSIVGSALLSVAVIPPQVEMRRRTYNLVNPGVIENELRSIQDDTEEPI